jgi:protein-disulfide isomerase
MKNNLLLILVIFIFLIAPFKVKDYLSLPKAEAGTKPLLQEEEIGRLNGRAIYPSDLDYDFNSRYTFELHKTRVKLYREQLSELQKFIDRVLLEKEAAGKGTTPEKLLTDVTGKANEEAKSMVGDKENLFQEFVKKISKKYEKSSRGVPAPSSPGTFAGMFASGDERYEPFIRKVKNKVVEMQKTSYVREKKDEFMDELRSKADIEILLERPELIKLAITPDDDPSMGSHDAPVTIVEFVDYQCPFCSKGTKILKEFVSKKNNNIRLIQRDFPLPSHKDARMAAEAAECANEQGKFWDYTELLFSNQQSLADENLQAYAARVGLNRKQFRDCLHGRLQRQEVDKDIVDAKMAGISSTPSIFINGYYIAGIPSLEYLEEVVADMEQGKVPRVQEHIEKG